MTSCNTREWAPGYIMDDFSLAPGKEPEVFSIVLGETRPEEMLRLMESYPYLNRTLESNPMIRYTEDSVSYYFLINEGIIDVVYVDNQLIGISYTLDDIAFDQVVDRFGKPDYIVLSGDQNERGFLYSADCLYLDLGLAVTVIPDEWKNDLVINGDSKVFTLTLMKIDSIESWYGNAFPDYDPSIYLQEWAGYGTISELYPNVIIVD
jgi:hypothetical protein